MSFLKVIGIVAMLTILVGCVSVGVSVPSTVKSPFFNSDKTKVDVLALYTQKPTINIDENGHEVYKFKKRNQWCGVFFIIVPVLLPVCSSYDAYVFDRDSLVRKEWRKTESHGLTCFFPPLADGVKCLSG